MSISPDPGALARAIANHDRRALAQAITLVESTREDHRQIAMELLRQLSRSAGDSLRIGISGVPGVGKSTLIEALGLHALAIGHRVAVLTVDPSSVSSKGSILGDKVRMGELSRHPEAFIRPSPSQGVLGGVSRRTRESILLCEASGFDVVIVETVGVGQSETLVADMTDLLVLMMLPASGDDLQAIKRGIMELADIVLVNKADGELAAVAQRTAEDCSASLALMPRRSTSWGPRVAVCSAISGDASAIWKAIRECQAVLAQTGELTNRRAAQAWSWVWQEAAETLRANLARNPAVLRQLPDLEAAVMTGDLPPAAAAEEMLRLFRGESAAGDESQS